MCPTSPGARDILRRRLDAQRLTSAGFASPREAVTWFGAIQAQDYLGALWAIGLRTPRTQESDIERAIEERAIVRSWPIRGTLHLLAAADARWMIQLLAPRVAQAAAGRMRALGIDAAVLSKARRVLVAELEGGRSLARPEVHRVLERAGIETSETRALMILWQLAHEGLLCMGPRAGKQHTFVLMEEWLPAGRVLRGDEALAEVAGRYFAGHGPATVRDFAWWSGLRLQDARRAIAAAGSALREETFDGNSYWSLSNAPPPSARHAANVAHLLPAFDELFVGYADRRALLEAAQAERWTNFELLAPTVVHDGRLLGWWKRRLTRGSVACSVTADCAWTTRERKDVHRAMQRYAAYLGLELAEEAERG